MAWRRACKPNLGRAVRVMLAALHLAATAHALGQQAVGGPEQPVVIQDVTVVDLVSGSLRKHTAVMSLGARIIEVRPATGFVVPSGARVIDGTDRYLIPGLWDMHSHSLLSADAMRTFLPLYIAQGITGIRDMGGSLPLLAKLRSSSEREVGSWPQVIAAGPILDGPQPVQAEISVPVSDEKSAIAAVDSLARAGVDFIKVYTLLPRGAYFRILAEARRLGLPVAGHVPFAVTPEEAARAGQRSIEHLRDETEPLCSSQAVAKCAQLANEFRKYKTWQVPTLVELRNKAFMDDPAIATDERLRYMPAGLREEWLRERRAKLSRGQDYFRAKRKRYADEVWLIKFLAREHVPLLAGTDAGTAFCYPGFSLHDELALFVQAGMTPLQALRTATLAPADYFHRRNSMGTIETGKVADMVLLRANPIVNISATRAIDTVMLRGRVFSRRDLEDLLGRAAEAQR